MSRVPSGKHRFGNTTIGWCARVCLGSHATQSRGTWPSWLFRSLPSTPHDVTPCDTCVLTSALHLPYLRHFRMGFRRRQRYSCVRGASRRRGSSYAEASRREYPSLFVPHLFAVGLQFTRRYTTTFSSSQKQTMSCVGCSKVSGPAVENSPTTGLPPAAAVIGYRSCSNAESHTWLHPPSGLTETSFLPNTFRMFRMHTFSTTLVHAPQSEACLHQHRT